MPPTLSSLRKAARTDQIAVLAVLALVVLGCFFVLRPFLSALLWAIILSFSSWPAYCRLLRWTKGRRNVAAFLMTLGITTLLLVPSLVIVLTLAGDVKEFAAATVSWFRQGPPTPPEWLGRIPWVGGEIIDVWNEYSADSKRLLSAMEQFVDPVSSWLLMIGKALGRGVLELSLSIFLSFFIFRDGSKLGDRALAVAQRLAGERGDYLLRDVAGGTIRGVVYGILGTAIAQGLLAGIGFSIAGVPAAVLLGLLTFLISVIPMGPPLVWLPASIWVFQNGSTGMGIFMLLWGFLVVSSVDNFIRPLIISQGNKMPFVLIFMGVVGGGLAFGLIGIFLGPTLLAVSYRLGEEWLAYRKSSASAAEEEVVEAAPSS
ncbi:MAG TPA: AI-2E family transporter [Bacteroidia bacterium]|nr:AI-2E family transporter [Bacteroidia bacterium]